MFVRAVEVGVILMLDSVEKLVYDRPCVGEIGSQFLVVRTCGKVRLAADEEPHSVVNSRRIDGVGDHGKILARCPPQQGRLGEFELFEPDTRFLQGLSRRGYDTRRTVQVTVGRAENLLRRVVAVHVSFGRRPILRSCRQGSQQR